MIDIFDIEGRKIESGQVLKDLLITKDCQHVEELMKSDYVQMSWRDTERYALPVGAYIIPFPEEFNPYTGGDSRYPIKYRLYEPYLPDTNSETEYAYEPQFEHPIMWLSRIPFMLITGQISDWNAAVKKTTWGYTGSARQIAMLVVDCINWLAAHYRLFHDEIGGGWTAFVDSDLTPSATVNFDATSIMGGAAQIAQAFDCEYHFDYARRQFRLGTIRYGEEVELITGVNVGVANVSRTRKDYHNVFLVKGSTRNLSQTTDGGENVQVTERLTLDPSRYPDSMIYTDENGNLITREAFLERGLPTIVEELVFDDIYPKLELYLYNVRERRCWLLDDDGNRVEDADGVLDPSDGKKYKAYSKWYTRLAYPVYTTDSEGNRTVSRWLDYKLSDDNIIEGQTVQITFLPNYATGSMNSLMLGQGDFDVAYYDKQVKEKGEDDMDADGFTAQEGDYRIVFKQSDNLIIPTTSAGGIFPQGAATPSLTGNKATLINVVVDDTYKEQAYLDLEMVAKRKVALLRSDLNNYELPSNPVYFEEHEPNLHIGQAVIYNDGQMLDGGTSYTLETHIIKIVTQLDYPFVREITVGNEKVKGDISTLKEQVQTMITGGGYASNTSSGGSGSGSGLSDDQIQQLINSYGSMYFLSKIHNDVARGHITFNQGLTSKDLARLEKGAQFGESFQTGLFGRGGKIDDKGHGELQSLTLRTWLEVPEIRFNRTTVNIGLKMHSMGGGIIETVTPIDETTGRCTLKLEEGEIGAISDYDLCMGIWHDEADLDGNEKADVDDKKGGFTFAGFKTVYFQIIECSGTNNSEFVYALRPINDGGNGIHPFAGMHFAQRGNTNDTSRQAFRYDTTNYSVWLADVSTWEFQMSNFIEIRGVLDGFSLEAINAEGDTYIKDFHGVGQVFGNAYIFGELQMFERLRVKMEVESTIGFVIAWGESTVLTCHVIRGGLEDITNTVKTWEIVRNSGDEASDNAWALKQKVKDFAGAILISFNAEENDLGDGLSTTFTITAKGDADEPIAETVVTF